MLDDPTMNERLARIDENLTLLRKDLLGNGQPGKIPKLEAKVEALEIAHNRSAGGLAVIFAGAGFGIEWLLRKLGLHL